MNDIKLISLVMFAFLFGCKSKDDLYELNTSLTVEGEGWIVHQVVINEEVRFWGFYQDPKYRQYQIDTESKKFRRKGEERRLSGGSVLVAYCTEDGLDIERLIKVEDQDYSLEDGRKWLTEKLSQEL